ncbi:hypothetical protein B566_EDAN017883 [Ephemera danica]|nr:hypothetical protein B566_EDAN017883 [Ephemera danica]
MLAAGLESRPRDFHQINRGQLINDAISLAEAGELDYTTALGMTRYMALETDCMPWSTAYDTLVYTNLRMDYLLEYRNLYTGYMLPRLAPVYALVNGFGILESDLHVIKIQRQVIVKWVCALDDPACNAEGSTLFTEWLNTPNPDLNNPIHPDLRDTVYCAGMRIGGQAEFDFLFARYENVPSEVYAELERIEFALGCSADTAMLTQYLDRSLDRTSALHGRFCFYAVVDNWRGLQTFLDENSEALLGAKAGVEEAIATLDKILAWHAAYGQEVVDYFRNNP